MVKGPASDLVVGVLGGLGPEATHDFFGKVLAATGAASDQEHLHLLIDNNPKVPNRNDAIAGRGPSAGPALAAMATRLEGAGAAFLVMPCNTASYYEPEIRAAISVPFIGIVPEAADRVRSRLGHGDPVGILAAGGCRQARLYETALEARGLVPVPADDEEQAGFMELLYAIKAGRRGEEVRAAMIGPRRAPGRSRRQARRRRLHGGPVGSPRWRPHGRPHRQHRHPRRGHRRLRQAPPAPAGRRTRRCLRPHGRLPDRLPVP